MYVMEGSTLGGRFIAPHVARLFDLAHGRGNAYFDGYGPRTGSMWNAFRETAAATVPDDQYDDAVTAAIATFDSLHAWLAGVRVESGGPHECGSGCANERCAHVSRLARCRSAPPHA